MRRVLIVTSSYSPAVIADMHRARMLAWDLPEHGWIPEILAPDISFQRPDCVDPQAGQFFREDTICHYVAPIAPAIFRRLKMRSIGWRALIPLYRKGCELLSSGRYSLVYISTTQFVLFALGSTWFKKFGIPYVLDFQDPWVRGIRGNITTKHQLRLVISSLIGMLLERRAVRFAAGIVAVSPNYIDQLGSRYPGASSVTPRRTLIAPFPARESDLEFNRGVEPSDTAIRRVVYVGAGGRIMAKAFGRIMQNLANIAEAEPELVNRLRIQLYGTGEPDVLTQVAKRFGLEGIVEEDARRVPYSVALSIASSADGLLILGVDDPAYMPSKLFTFALTGKPLLASLHEKSQANKYFIEVPETGNLINYGEQQAKKDFVTTRTFLAQVLQRRYVDRRARIQPFLSPAAARLHADLFNSFIRNHRYSCPS